MQYLTTRLINKIEERHYKGVLGEHDAEALIAADYLNLQLLPGYQGIDAKTVDGRLVEIKTAWCSTFFDYEKNQFKTERTGRKNVKGADEYAKKLPKIKFHPSEREMVDCVRVRYYLCFLKNNGVAVAYDSRSVMAFHKYLCSRIKRGKEFKLGLASILKFGLVPMATFNGGCPEIYPQ